QCGYVDGADRQHGCIALIRRACGRAGHLCAVDLTAQHADDVSSDCVLVYGSKAVVAVTGHKDAPGHSGAGFVELGHRVVALCIDDHAGIAVAVIERVSTSNRHDRYSLVWVKRAAYES